MTALAANPGNAVTLLEPGIPIILANNVTAAQSVPGTSLNVVPGGLGTNPIFTVNASGMNTSRTVNLHARGIGGTLTAVTVQLWASDDGVNWNEYQEPITLVQAGVITDYQALYFAAGFQYQALVSALTLNTATGVSIDGGVS